MISAHPHWPTRFPGPRKCSYRPGVTVIVAACDRPDVLPAVLRCVKRQTIVNWTTLVIGDCCDESIASCVSAMEDERFHYINLAKRSGGQHGPNTVGLYLADTKFVAFLNHDDLWLPDHLEKSVAALERQDADLCLGRAAFAATSDELVAKLDRPAFVELNVPSSLRRAYAGANYIFEPASSWLLRTEFAFRIGPWRPAYMLHRTSLQDWLLRAWRLRPVTILGEEPTTLKLNIHHDPRRTFAGQSQYAVPQPHYGTLVNLIEQLGSEGIRVLIYDDVSKAHERNLPVRNPGRLEVVASAPSWLKHKTTLNLLAEIYRWTGFDFVHWYLWQPDKRIKYFHELIRVRTGQTIDTLPNLTETLQYADEQLVPVHRTP
ncbi:MAG: glycosyltransferase family A protein [Parvibaculum sp.]|uniref:glycosyltransferase family 2 protein n=1 Tax=Parvibaculum sp. TaxID=2024848 RepID=UPI002715EA7E|nr:glycosyltransferase family A protein [Parvibaculum sp.]MDO8837295.1 glycosyltransferase family A protein [Parvibaculum sp.]